MTTRNINLHRLAILPLGTVTMRREGDAARQKWVYQRVLKGCGNIPTRHPRDMQLRRHVIPDDPQTTAQLARRAVFAAAVAAWHALTPAERQAWAEQGKPRALPGYNWFISHYLRNN